MFILIYFYCIYWPLENVFEKTTLHVVNCTANPLYKEEKQRPRDRMHDPYWFKEDEDICELEEDKIDDREVEFWRDLIEKYLKPLESDKNKETETKAKLIELRDKVCLIFILINSLFIIIVFSLQQVVADGKL